MRILVIGSGGREHALVWKIAQSKLVDKIFCAPGNGGISQQAECLDIKVEDIPALLEFARKEKIDLTVVGPEAPLSLGIVDEFVKYKLRIFGPNKKAAQLEVSKVFAKELMAKYKVKSWDAYFPQDEYYQVMHIKLFPKKIVHAENLGGDINKLSNKRAWIGCFPLKGIELESAMCRIVALLPKTGK